MSDLKILMLDIELRPNIAYVWNTFNQNIGLNQIAEPARTLCWAARWHGDEEGAHYFDAEWKNPDFLEGIYELMDEADAVITYNGKSFDHKILFWEFALKGWEPPAPFKDIDLLNVTRKKFRPLSRKLDFISQELGIGQKIEHEGMALWTKCMNGDKDAQKRMEEYNIMDVLLLEDLYEQLLPWIDNHPNLQLYTGERDTCPKCGSKHIEYRGYSYTGASKYRRIKCNDCGSWSKSPKSVDTSNLRGGNI